MGDPAPGRPVMPPLARLNMWAYGFGGVLVAGAALTDGFYRPGAWFAILLAGAGLSLFGLVILVRRREPPIQAMLANLYALLLIGFENHTFAPAVARSLSTINIPAIGIIILSAATRLSVRLVIPLMSFAVLEIAVIQPRYGTALLPNVVPLLATTVLCLAPAITVITYRRQLERALATVQQLARTDPLTGLANRRGLAEQVPELVAAALRSGRPIAVLAADLDHFKRINDQFGHAAGDDVLVECATAIRRVMRKEDLVARIGGEEFCVVALMDVRGVVDALADRIRTAVEQDVVRCPVTVSVGGVEVLPAGLAGEDPIELLWTALDQADALLYQAKEAGRNAVRVLAA